MSTAELVTLPVTLHLSPANRDAPVEAARANGLTLSELISLLTGFGMAWIADPARNINLAATVALARGMGMIK